MLRIGLVDLDTSHPQAFTTILKQTFGAHVVALCDHHDVWPEGYDRDFARNNGIAAVLRTPAEMLPLIDAAMVHSVNWDRHLERALPFIRAAMPVLIDKPVVGTLRDCFRLVSLRAQHGGLIFGGSSLRFAEEVTALKSRLASAGPVTSVTASGPGDFFSYGIHTTEMAQAIVGTGAMEVEFLGGDTQPCVTVLYGGGTRLQLRLSQPAQDWTLSAQTASGEEYTAHVNPANLYPPFLRAFLAAVRGESRLDTITPALEAVKIHLAADLSRRTGKRVSLARIPDDAAFDGAAFAADYAAAKRSTP